MSVSTVFVEELIIIINQIRSNIAMLKERFVNKSVLSIVITNLYNHFVEGSYYKDNPSVDHIDLVLYSSQDIL